MEISGDGSSMRYVIAPTSPAQPNVELTTLEAAAPGAVPLGVIHHSVTETYQHPHRQHLKPSSVLAATPSVATSDFHPSRASFGLTARPHIPFKIILVVSLCVFTVAPAIILWMLSWQTATEGLNGMNQLGQESVEATAYQLRGSLIQGAKDRLVSFLKPTEDSVRFVLHLANANDIFALDGDLALSAYPQIWNSMQPMYQMMHINKPMTMLNFNIYANRTWLDLKDASSDQRRTGDFGGASSRRLHAISAWATFARMNIDYFTNERREVIYLAEQTLNEAQNETILQYWYINQVSGAKIVSLYEENYHKVMYFATDLTVDEMLWDDVLYFNDNLGIPQMIIDAQQVFADNRACVHVQATVDVWKISAFLKSMLSGWKERLFVNIRSPSGHLIGASHGKFFSHSDVDYGSINAIADPPPISDLRPFTPLNSTDATISAAAQWIFEMFQGWDALPQLNTVQKFNGERFWLASDYTQSETHMDLNVFLIIDLDSKMGPIERHQQKTIDNIAQTNNRLTIILACVVAGALLFALLISLLLTRSLSRLAFGMDTLAMLEFADGDNGFGMPGTSFIRSQSRFTEVFKCERSFVALERGLKAFVKYVPKDVVHLMLTGEMESSHLMVRRRVTILFMDIAGFTPLCEKLSAEDLMRLTNDYLQAMCTIIVSSHGTLDKFVGDCIMAMWNAPRRLKSHEAYAVTSVLEMQLRLKRLHQTWSEEGLPEIYFRAGLNTGEVLVGNFGCDYRISYTCLGDGVNLASRLESLNKYLGTVVVVAETTYGGAANQFVFRKIGLVTVAGKTTKVPIYEPLYCDDDELVQGGRGTMAVTSDQEATSATEGLWLGNVRPSTTNRPLMSSSPQSADEAALPSPASSSPRALLPASLANSVVPLEPNFNHATATTTTNATVLYNWRMVSKNALATMATLYERAYMEMMRGDLEKAMRWLLKSKELIPHDGPTKFLLEECARAQPPSPKYQQGGPSTLEVMMMGVADNFGAGASSFARKQTTTLFSAAGGGGWDGVFRFDQK